MPSIHKGCFKMVKLEHINLVVNDLTASGDFIQTAFPHWTIRGQGQNEWYGIKRNWVHIGTQEYYITLNDGGQSTNRNLRSHDMGLAHIGFQVDDLEGIAQRLQDKGYEIATIGAEHPYRKTLYFIDPAGFEFEFIEYLSDKADLKNQYGGETSGITRIASA